MIIKSFEINKINLDKNPYILLYGKNDGLKNDCLKNLLKNKNNIVSYYEEEILEKTNDFIESIQSQSLFEKERILIVKKTTDKIFKIINEFLVKNIKDIIIIFVSDNLEKRSKLRSHFEKEKNCVCIPIYPDTQETLIKLSFQFLSKNKISISNSNINMIVNKCNGDRKILMMELEKIQNFARNGKKVTTENIAKLANLIENHSISELVDNCLAQNKHKTINIILENNFSSEDCIQITRTFLTKLKKILKLSTEYQNNKDLDYTISSAKPPIFWKEKEITKQQILNSSPEKIKKSLFKINNIELLIKKNYENSIKLVTDFILNELSTKSNN